MTDVSLWQRKFDAGLVKHLQNQTNINWSCQTCNEFQSPDMLPLLSGRAIVISVHGGDDEDLWRELVMCSHCMFHQTNCRTRLCSASFSKLGAPLDQDSANAFIRMMGFKDPDSLQIIVL